MFRKLLIIACLSGIVFSVSAQKKKTADNIPAPYQQEDYKTPGTPLPPVRFVTKDKKSITNKDLKNDANLIIMLFNPTCEHCEVMTAALRDNIFLFNKTKLLLVAGPAMLDYMDYFTNNIKIKDYPSIQLSVDSSNYIEKTFLYTNLPQVNVYDKNHKLLKTFSGITTVDSLKQYIE